MRFIPAGTRIRRLPNSLACVLLFNLGLAAILLPLASQATPPTKAPTSYPPEKIVADDQFEPREEAGTGLDWIQLTSGEWLRGTVDRIRVDSIEFDSKELDELTLDLDDVYAVVTNGPQTISLDTRRLVVGNVAIRGNIVRIRTKTGVQTYTRGDVLGMVPGLPTEWNYWSGTASIGLTLQKGNTNQTDFTAIASVMRETANTRATSQYNGTISSANGAQTGNNHRVDVQGDILITRRFYITVLAFEYYTNRFQDINLRLVPSAGVGYSIVDNGRTAIDIEVGAGATYTQTFDSTSPSTLISRTNASVIFRLRFDTDITKSIEWSGEYKVQLGVPETQYTFQHALTTLSVDLWRDIDLDTSFIWDRNQANAYQPTPDSPVPDDFRLTFGLGIDF
ncbi:MAG: hypothetical protein CBC48_16580 [bacterium TMED88]|nr:hypothetical protein [Deltaproteobacteria bacterium]OUV25249.1 MAG: hypothetical protein CBC48_16580 [bacterium TMED88]